ncbi:Pancreatic lipase-related protein 1, partial [Stegodyphus mimosarum]
MRLCLLLSILIIVPGFTLSYQSFLRQVLGSALMGDLLSTLPSRFHCVGTRNNFTTFKLFSRVHPDKPRPLAPDDRELLYKSDFDPNLPTKIIIHGFVDNLQISEWMQKMKNAFLSEGEYNVIITDWSCGNEFPYTQAVHRSKTVAEKMKELIIFLRDSTGADPANFHLIGHSLGSHIAGLVGHGIPHLGRISALDPAGPRFYDAPLAERLDPTDAQFVDVIHTDGGRGLLEGLGMRSQVGHVDFYPNGGRNQPGCHNSPLTILPRIGLHRAARYYITCDHFRSTDYYIDSIRSSRESKSRDESACQSIGVTCRNWETFAQGRCADCSHPDDCLPMGYHSDIFVQRNPHLSKKEYFVKTADESPFCLFQYQVIVETACDHGFCGEASNSKSGFNPGVINLELKTNEGKLTKLNIDEDADKNIKPGGQYVYLGTSRFPIGQVQNAKIWWGDTSKPEAAARPSQFSTGLNLRKIQVVPIVLQGKIDRLSEPQPIVLCGSPDKTIGRNRYLELSVNEC